MVVLCLNKNMQIYETILAAQSLTALTDNIIFLTNIIFIIIISYIYYIVRCITISTASRQNYVTNCFLKLILSLK